MGFLARLFQVDVQMQLSTVRNFLNVDFFDQYILATTPMKIIQLSEKNDYFIGLKNIIKMFVFPLYGCSVSSTSVFFARRIFQVDA